MTSFDFPATARMPFGMLLKEIVALECRGHGGVPPESLDDAINIQRDLIAIEIIRTDVEAGGPMRALVRQDRLEKIVNIPVQRMIAPPGRAFERFRLEYLIDSETRLDDVIVQATAMQDKNLVPGRVPPIGTVYCSAQTGLGKDGGALINHFGLTGGLMIQSCCRCLLLPDDRAAFSVTRIYETDPPSLQDAQKLLNKLIEARRLFTQGEGERVSKLMAVGIGWLFDAGFGAYAFTVKDFIDDPEAPFRTTTLKNWSGSARA